MVHRVQLFLGAVNWTTSALRDLGSRDQINIWVLYVWSPVFTCCLNIWKMSLKCAKGKHVPLRDEVEGVEQGFTCERESKGGKGRQERAEETGAPVMGNTVTGNGEKYNNVLNSLWLLVVFKSQCWCYAWTLRGILKFRGRTMKE